VRLCLVEWVDSAFVQGWIDRKVAEGHKESNCVSVGILLYENDERITIVQDTSDSGNVGDGITIPKSCIKRIRYLKLMGELNGRFRTKR